MLENPLYLIYIDGASSGNPGPAGIGILVCRDGEKIHSISRSIGKTTNNVAEYKALITGLKYGVKNGIKNTKVYSDSELIVKQIQGKYSVRDIRLKKLYREAMSLIKKISTIEVIHIPSKENREANRLAQTGIKY